MNLSVVDVAACIVTSPDGRVLLAERRPRQVAAGYWELPGGKIEPGETASQAAARELREETGLQASGLSPFLSYEYCFPGKRLRLQLFRARDWAGTPHGREGQRMAWVDPRHPHVGPVLPSNDRALFTLGLPPTYVLAEPGKCESIDVFLAVLQAALVDGARLVRLKGLPKAPGQAAALLARVASLASAFPGTCVLTPNVADSRRAGLSGVHSAARDLRWLTARPAVRVWAATCHDGADLSRAISLGADFAVLSPILADPEIPGVVPHGWDGLRRLAASCPIPVFAEGGLSPASQAHALAMGAAGLVVAVGDKPAGSRANHARQLVEARG